MNHRVMQILFCLLALLKIYQFQITTDDLDKFFNIKKLKEKFENEKQNLLANAKKAKPLTKTEKKNKIQNYRRYLMQIKQKKYNTPEKSIVFNLAQEFLAKSIKSRKLKLEECKVISTSISIYF
jgi:uncharacterized protein YnzC (UPF0291/DUF896 family)